MAYFAYRQYYPSLASELSHRPYSPRIKREEQEHLLPIHARHVSSSAIPEDGARHSSDEFELDGTVPRPVPGSLDHLWREGDDRDANSELVPVSYKDAESHPTSAL